MLVDVRRPPDGPLCCGNTAYRWAGRVSGLFTAHSLLSKACDAVIDTIGPVCASDRAGVSMLPYHPRPEEAGRNAVKQHVVTSKAASERVNHEGVFLRVIAPLEEARVYCSDIPGRLTGVQIEKPPHLHTRESCPRHQRSGIESRQRDQGPTALSQEEPGRLHSIQHPVAAC